MLVAGATGVLGLEICRQLTAANKSVKGLVRPTSDPSKVNSLRQMGVETVEGDVKDRSSLDAAMQNVESVISTVSSTISRSEGDSIETVDREGQLNLIEAAKAAGINQFILLSFPVSPESFPLQDAKREAEQRLMGSGLNYTILQPGFFMDIWLSPVVGFDFPNHKATIYGEGKNKISWIAVKDVAAFAIAALDNPDAKNNIIELGGPQAFSPLEIVRIFEQQGHPFEIVQVPEEALRAQKNSSTDPLQLSFLSLMLTLARGGEIDMHENFRKFSVEPTSVSAYVKKVTETAGAEL